MEELKKLQERHREIIILLADINDIEKNVSRIHNELLEMDKTVQSKMNGDE